MARRRQLIRMTLDMPEPTGIGEDAIALLRPSLLQWAQESAAILARDIRTRLSGSGSGVQYAKGERASAPGAPPARQTGEYAGSYDFDIKNYKNSIQGRVGSPLWRTQGATLELGNSRIRPRPHIWPAFLKWKQDIVRQIQRQERGGAF